MKVLLLCGYRSLAEDESALGTALSAASVPLLDHRIQQFEAYGHEVICVLSGPHADDQLRHCRRIQNTELVFDTNEQEATLLTNIRSGLKVTTSEAVIVHPVEIPVPEREDLDFLRYEWLKSGIDSENSIAQICDSQGAPWHFGFPILITPYGNAQLQKTGDFTSLLDKRLRYLHLIRDGAGDLCTQR